MDNAIQLAGSILEEVRQNITDLNKRFHPTPSRKARRSSVNFIQNLFDNEEDMPRDFMVSFSLAFLGEFSELMHISPPPPKA